MTVPGIGLNSLKLNKVVYHYKIIVKYLIVSYGVFFCGLRYENLYGWECRVDFMEMGSKTTRMDFQGFWGLDWGIVRVKGKNWFMRILEGWKIVKNW